MSSGRRGGSGLLGHDADPELRSRPARDVCQDKAGMPVPKLAAPRGKEAWLGLDMGATEMEIKNFPAPLSKSEKL